MLNLFSMMGNYDERVVARFDSDEFSIDTAYVTDRAHPYETAIAHTKFHAGDWIILGWRDTKEEAQKFHNEMVAYYTCHGDAVQKIEDVYDNVVYERKGGK